MYHIHQASSKIGSQPGDYRYPLKSPSQVCVSMYWSTEGCSKYVNVLYHMQLCYNPTIVMLKEGTETLL